MKKISRFPVPVFENLSEDTSEEDFKNLRNHGMTDADIFDTIAYASFYNMSNRMVAAMKIMPDI